ncbi:Hsp20/alpha crystallin family protein [Phytohabitans kaempferiae]|uniref:Hsp20/alpha crystallin family protein n=1 Tax=Phytohabitans kaempferiae TaxID=1620943 RepID=A0ABV6LX49_9ACTN
MLMRIDPFHKLDRLTQTLLAGNPSGTWSRPAAMPIDTYRAGDEFLVAFDLPGVAPDAIEIDVERNVLTVRAERRPPELGDSAQLHLSERPLGVFSRQLLLSDALDTDRIQASYDNGVLLVRIPIAEQAKPRKVAVTSATDRKAIHA